MNFFKKKQQKAKATGDEVYLSFTINVLRTFKLWPTNYDLNNQNLNWKDLTFIIFLMPSTLPIVLDFVWQLYYDQKYNFLFLIENLIAIDCIFGMIYMLICFINSRALIVRLVVRLQQFDKHFNHLASRLKWQSMIREIDDKANLYCKVFLFYGLIGNFVYMVMPYFNINQCKEMKMVQVIDDDIPCGLVTRCRWPFRFDYSPIFEMVFLHQFFTSNLVSGVVLVLSMLLCGLLMHVSTHLKILRIFINALEDQVTFSSVQNRDLLWIIKYHIDIIEFSQETSKAFRSMMMIHLTLTSVVISLLGFEILIVRNLWDSLRFSLHLFGWLFILFQVCYHAQNLLDQSVAISQEIYFTPWFRFNARVQRDICFILLRSQKPLYLDAANIGVMSLPTFLRVIYSAYSYFTLLSNVKS